MNKTGSNPEPTTDQESSPLAATGMQLIDLLSSPYIETYLGNDADLSSQQNWGKNRQQDASTNRNLGNPQQHGV